MKTKKSSIIVLAVLIVVVAIASAVFFPTLSDAAGNLNARKYTSGDLKNVDNIVLLAHCAQVDGENNSVAGVKEAVRQGANAVIVDMCFRSDGTPVMADKYEKVDNAPELEELFRAITTEKYADVKIYLNIVQLSDLSKLNKLVTDYDVISRTVMTGIDSEHYGLVTSDDTILPFYIDYKVTQDDVKAIKSGSFSTPEVMSKYGASGLVIDIDDCTEEVIGAMNDRGIPVVVASVTNNSQLSKALTANAQTVQVKNTARSAKFLSEWIEAMQIRYESSVKESLNALSSKTAN